MEVSAAHRTRQTNVSLVMVPRIGQVNEKRMIISSINIARLERVIGERNENPAADGNFDFLSI